MVCHTHTHTHTHTDTHTRANIQALPAESDAWSCAEAAARMALPMTCAGGGAWEEEEWPAGPELGGMNDDSRPGYREEDRLKMVAANFSSCGSSCEHSTQDHGEASQCKHQVWCNIGTMHSIDPRYSIDKVAVVHAQGPLKDG